MAVPIYGQFYFSGTVVYFIATIGAMFTTLYSVKVLYLTFFTNPNGPIVNYRNISAESKFYSELSDIHQENRYKNERYSGR
jgi:NADH-ubiquinone oxidoreductase chain 5